MCMAKTHLDQPRSESEGRAQRVHGAGARYSRQRRRGIPLSAARNDGDDAGLVDASRILRIDLDTETGKVIGLS